MTRNKTLAAIEIDGIKVLPLNYEICIDEERRTYLTLRARSREEAIREASFKMIAFNMQVTKLIVCAEHYERYYTGDIVRAAKVTTKARVELIVWRIAETVCDRVDKRTKTGRLLRGYYGSKEAVTDAIDAKRHELIRRADCRRLFDKVRSFVEEARSIKRSFGGIGSYAKRVEKSFRGEYWLCSPEYGPFDYNASRFKECRSDKAMKAWNAWLDK